MRGYLLISHKCRQAALKLLSHEGAASGEEADDEQPPRTGIEQVLIAERLRFIE